MIFRLYDVPTDGTHLWEEQWTGSNGVRVSDGLFNVMLGSLNPIGADVIVGHDQLWLGITVGTDDEMQPRVQLGSVPYAVQALTVPDGSITTAKIADGAVTQAKLSDDVQIRLDVPILDWSGKDVSFDALGMVQERLLIPTTLQITVPAGDTHLYAVHYAATFRYQYEERIPADQTGFYGYWYVELLSGDQVLGSAVVVVHTGYREQWSAVGGNWYWNQPVRAMWLVKLGPGTHILQLRIGGYSDNTMQRGYMKSQKLQAVRLH